MFHAIAARFAVILVVHHHEGAGVEFEGAFDDFARIDRGVVDGATLLGFVGDDLVLTVEVDEAELFGGVVGHARLAVVEQIVPGRDDVGVAHAGLKRELDRGLYGFQHERGAFADPGDFDQRVRTRGEDFVEAAEFGEQGLCDGLGVAARDHADK